MGFLNAFGRGWELFVTFFFYHNSKNPYLKELSMIILKVLGKKFCLYWKLCQNFIAHFLHKKIITVSVWCNFFWHIYFLNLMSFLSRDVWLMYSGGNNLNHGLKSPWSCYTVQAGYWPRMCELDFFFLSGK